MTNTRGHLQAAKIYAVSESGQEMAGGGCMYCMFNPYEYTISKTNSFRENPSVDKTKGEIYMSGAQTLSLKLFFDTYESGKDVSKETKELWKFMQVDQDNEKGGSTTKKYPPQVAFEWGVFKFLSYITSITQRFSLFKSDGTPVRAEVNITFTHYEEPQPNQNPSSGGGPTYRVHRVVAGERLDAIAAQTYGDASKWRLIAQANQIVNPLALRPGQVLRLPYE